MRPSGIDVIGDIPWGTHLCQFYETEADLLEVLVPYLKDGLAANEFCMWVTSEPLRAEKGVEALKRAVPDLDDRIARGQIEILDYSQWYTKSGRFDAEEVLQGWLDKLAQARQNGYEGLRLTCNTYWLEDADWEDFEEYEKIINDMIGNHPMLAICSYSLNKCSIGEVMDVIVNHQFALMRRSGRWEVVESSQHKRTEMALRESEQKYRTLFESMSEGFALHEMVYDRSGKPVDYTFLEANPAFERLTGLRTNEIQGRRVLEILPDVEPSWIERYGEVATTGRPSQFEDYAAALGKWFKVYAFSPQQGKFAAIFNDITDRKKAEEVLAIRADELAHSNAELQQFAYVASHDLQEPIRTVMNNLALLTKRHGPEMSGPAREYINMAMTGAERMRELVNELLEYSRIETRGKPLAYVDLNEVVKDTIASLKVAIDESDAQVIVEHLPTVWGDGVQLAQVLQNLVSNAIKFHGPNHPIVNIRSHETVWEWIVAVEDNGIGIDTKYFNNIFQMFHRLHTQEEYEGTGMGLAISKKIVERYGGRIWVESQPSNGSTFFFSIPKVEP